MKYVIVGASAAGINIAKRLRELEKEAEIIVVSKDEQIASRCRLHQYLGKEKTLEALNFANPGDFFEAYHIEWQKGKEVVSIDTKAQNISLKTGETISYDKLALAVGSHVFIPPVEGLREAKNVIGLKTPEDVQWLFSKLGQAKDIIILGAGLIGLDALSGLLAYEVKVHLVEMAPRLVPLQLDDYSSKVYEEKFKKEGVDIKLGVAAQKVVLNEKGEATSLQLNTGEALPCDLIIVAAGVRANVEWIKASGIECDRFGLIVNAKGETNTKNVYGAGDVTGRNPIWPSAVKAGIIVANNMAGNEIFLEDYFSAKNTMSFLGTPTLSLGTPNKVDETYEEAIEVLGENYKKIIHKDGRIYGVILQGDLSYAGVLTQLVRFKRNIKGIRKPILEIDYGDFFNIKANQEYTY